MKNPPERQEEKSFHLPDPRPVASSNHTGNLIAKTPHPTPESLKRSQTRYRTRLHTGTIQSSTITTSQVKRTMGAIRRSKTKRRTRDMDQVHSDLRDPKQLTQLKALVPDEDRPGLGRFHCVECAKYFESEWNMVQHRRGKNHKRRARLLKEEPYSQKEADAAAGIGTAAFYQASEDKKEQEKTDQRLDSMELE